MCTLPLLHHVRGHAKVGSWNTRVAQSDPERAVVLRASRRGSGRGRQRENRLMTSRGAERRPQPTSMVFNQLFVSWQKEFLEGPTAEKRGPNKKIDRNFDWYQDLGKQRSR